MEERLAQLMRLTQTCGKECAPLPYLLLAKSQHTDGYRPALVDSLPQSQRAIVVEDSHYRSQWYALLATLQCARENPWMMSEERLLTMRLEV